jgi:CelD/BcsL family acetyltransferase involved in cellulose biosynthesis
VRLPRSRETSFHPATIDEWQAAWLNDPSAEFYQSPEWADMWVRQTPGVRLAPARVVLGSGITVVVPLIKQVRYAGTVTRLVSNPTGSPTGWLSDRPLTDQEAMDLVDGLYRLSGDLDWRSSPLQHRMCLRPTMVVSSQIIDLRRGPDEIRGKWSKGHRSAYNQGIRAGVEVRLGETRQDWERHHDMYRASIERWRASGKPVTSSFERPVFEALRTTNGVRLWVAEHGGELVAGAIFLYAARTIIYWNGAFCERAAKLRPSNVLLGEAMLRCAAEGFEWLDLGASGIHENVAAFKRRLGAVTVPFGIFTKKSAPTRAIDAIRPLKRALASG